MKICLWICLKIVFVLISFKLLKKRLKSYPNGVEIGIFFAKNHKNCPDAACLALRPPSRNVAEGGGGGIFWQKIAFFENHLLKSLFKGNILSKIKFTDSGQLNLFATTCIYGH